MLDRIAALATVKVLAAFIVALAVIELVLRQVVAPESQWLLSLAGFVLALALMVIGGAPLLQNYLEDRREE